MAEYRRAEIVSGLFIVLSVMVFALFAFKVKGLPIWFFEDEGVECEAWFADVKQLDSAAKVTIGGHRIGTVTAIESQPRAFTEEEIADERSRRETLPADWVPGRERPLIRVKFKITEPDVRLAPEATVAVVQEGFIGAWYLAIEPGTWDPAHRPPAVRDRKDVPIRLKSEHTETLQDFIPALRPIIQQVDSILTRIDEELLKPLLEGRASDLANLIPTLQGTVADARAGVNELRQVVDPKAADSPVRRLNVLLDNADQSVTDLKTQVLRDVIPPLKAAIADGSAALAAAKKTMDNAAGVLDDTRPKVKEILENLRLESGRLEARIGEIQKKLATLLDDADHVVSLRQADLALTIESLRNAAWEMELAARKVRANPAVLIFGDEEDQRLEAAPRDDTGLRKSGRVKPYEQRDESPTKKD
jgi:ABC-type transporter Mla subunit MlaD